MKKIPCVPAQLKGSLLIFFFVMSSYPNCNSPSVFPGEEALRFISNKDSTVASNIDHMQIDHENQSTILLVWVSKDTLCASAKEKLFTISFFLLSNQFAWMPEPGEG